MTRPQLALDDALRALDSNAALTTGAIAHRLNVTHSDAHILMLTAQANRLVYTTAAGQWAITERGRQTLQASTPGPNERPGSG
jgi:hypothetical protein